MHRDFLKLCNNMYENCTACSGIQKMRYAIIRQRTNTLTTTVLKLNDGPNIVIIHLDTNNITSTRTLTLIFKIKCQFFITNISRKVFYQNLVESRTCSDLYLHILLLAHPCLNFLHLKIHKYCELELHTTGNIHMLQTESIVSCQTLNQLVKIDKALKKICC